MIMTASLTRKREDPVDLLHRLEVTESRDQPTRNVDGAYIFNLPRESILQIDLVFSNSTKHLYITA
jgi:hypothetical protein